MNILMWIVGILLWLIVGFLSGVKLIIKINEEKTNKKVIYEENLIILIYLTILGFIGLIGYIVVINVTPFISDKMDMISNKLSNKEGIIWEENNKKEE